ncbi:PLxRFG domain-containing protein [Paracoccus sp. M683]|uniref:PLxRFG domain-containing protein n=1 Tax=Paracoccus sp. M683 TaxID=2594268 RepID=UPI00117D3F58|nr:PLxRFG domain-containing protein [Paracoccus sp. M683]TRW94932.1 PLxRFG domain-containing protein [Paracoccus sp. M683]
MARLPFSTDPYSEQIEQEKSALRGRGVVLPGDEPVKEKPKVDGASTKAEIEAISRESNVPANVLMALAEKDGAGDGAAAIESARRNAQSLRGKDLAATVDGAVLDRAEAIRKAVYPDAPNTVSVKKDDPFEGEGVGSLLKRRGQQLIAGATDAVAGVAEGAALAERARRDDANDLMTVQAEELSKRIDAMRANLPKMTPAQRESAERILPNLEQKLSTYQRGMDATRKGRSLADTGAYQAGTAIKDASKETFGEPDKRDDGLWSQVARGGGNVVGMIGTALSPVGAGGAALSGMGMTQRQMYEEALASGVDEKTATQVAQIGTAIGMTEMVPVLNAIKPLAKPLQQRITGTLSRRLMKIAESSGEEAAQEALSQLMQNATAKGYYDPDRGIMDGVGMAALVGGIIGGGMGTVGAMRTPGEKPQPEALPAPDRLALPSPGAFALPAPSDRSRAGLNFPGAPRIVNPQGGAAAPASDPFPQVDEKGRLEKALERAPGAAPVAAGIPGVEPGSTITVTDGPTGEVFSDAVFIGATDRGIEVEIAGERLTIDPNEITSGAVSIAPVAAPEQEAGTDADIIARDEGEPATEPVLPDSADDARDGRGAGDAGPVLHGDTDARAGAGNAETDAERGDASVLASDDSGLAGGLAVEPDAGQRDAALTPRDPLGAKAQSAVDQITPPGARRVTIEDEIAAMSPEQARKSLTSLQQAARSQGWNLRRTRMRDALEKVIAAAPPAVIDTESEALTGEIITPEDDAARQQDAAKQAGFELTAPPVPARAPWWTNADEATRAAIVKEAGPIAARDLKDAMVWDRMTNDGKRALQDAYGRLYRAGKIENAGTIEAPRPALAAMDKASLVIEPIRAKAAILRGWTGPDAPEVPGVSIKHDAKEGGWIFSRKHEDKVRSALGLMGTPAPEVIAQAPTVADAAAETAPDPNDAPETVESGPKPLPKPSERAEMMAEAMGLDDPYSAGRIQEEAEREGWENLAFQFKIEKPDGRHSYAWTDSQGKVIARMKRMGMPAALKDGRYRDALSAAIPVAEAKFKPAWAFRKAWEAPGEVRAPQKNTPAQDRPKPGDSAYTRDDAVADLHALEGQRNGGMIADARLEERINKQRNLVESLSKSEADTTAGSREDPAPARERAWSNPPAPLSPQPHGPRRFDWWWTNNPNKRGVALANARLDTSLSRKLSGEVSDALTPDQYGALTDAIFGPHAENKPTKSTPKIQQAQAQAAQVEEPAQVAPKVAQPTQGVLGVLSQEKQDRAAELKARLAAKARNQASSGIDPEYITLGGELVALYIEAGAKRFGQMLRDFAESTGLTLREAQAPMRAAYNHVRDDMDLNGQDVSDMDDAAAVMAEVRAALAEADAAPDQSAISQSPAENDNIAAGQEPEEASDDRRTDGSNAGASPRRGPEADQSGRTQSLGEPGARGGRPNARDDGPGREDRGARAERGADAERDDLSRVAGGTDRADRGARNHVIPEGGLALAGGDKTRARNAVKAIETLRTLEREGRPASRDERQALSLYSGSGTLAPALPNSEGKVRFPDIAADLDRLLTPEERATVEKTSQYAFYTAEPVLRNMWNLAMQLGITGGQVFEPGMGVGGFAGTMPKGFFGKYSGIELDHITAKIAAALYPNHHIKHGDFIKTPMPQDYYDLAIGNPPFARTQIKADPSYPQGFMIHDYFFAKTLDSVRPGGLLMFVTSAGTMNKIDSKARDYMADRADLVGAIRLPNTAFAENGTQVTTDIIVLRKRHAGEAEADPSWRESTAVALPDKDGGTVELAVNRYFQAHPEMILGEQGAFDTLVGRPRIGVRAKPEADLATDLAAAVARFPRKITSMGDPQQMMIGPRDAKAGETKAGSYYLKDGDLWQFDGSEGKPVQRRAKGQSGLTKADYELVTDLLPLRNALREVYSADLAGADAVKARKRLNKEYDAFVSKRGPINKVETTLRRPSAVQMEGLRQQAAEDARAAGASFDIGSFDAGPMIEGGATLAQIARARREASQQTGYREGDFDPDAVDDIEVNSFPNIDAFSDDPENFRLRAIEKYDRETGIATKTRVFTENAINKSVRPKINSPEDALLHLLAETGRVDIDRIADLSGSSAATVREELADKVFENPATGEFETRAKYLSGNVRAKFREAEAAMRRDDRFKTNVDALAAVLPDPIPRSAIVVPLGAHWFDHGLYGEFAKAKGLNLKAEFKPALGLWVVDGDTRSLDARNAWGTEDLPFADLMRRAMNNKPMRVTRTVKSSDGSTSTTVDEEATQAAAEKATEIKAAFQEWLWSDEARADRLEEQYNETFNAEVAPSYDGGYLTTPGVYSDWSWRPHQTAVIARILQSGSTYMAHTVGAGKTSAMIGAGMEARRLGLARKPWYVVPNHMLVQFATEFQHQYPLADILVADEKRFHTDRRKQFVADAATGEFDAVIITHSAFEKIPASEAAKGRVVQGILDDIREMVDSGNDTGDRGKDAGQQQATLGALNSIAAQLGIKIEKEKGVSTAKKIAQVLEQAEQRLSKLTSDTRKDAVFDFDEIGVDMLFVDEAHLFRKLSFATTNGNIKGIDPAGSQASMDLFIKSRIVNERNPGRGLVLASGTPITNTMAELYTLSRLMQPEALEERNITAFDAWAATFGEVASELEQTPDGGYKEVSRFSKFVNTPELSLMVRQIMDVVTSADLEQYVTRPKLKDGGRNLVVVDATPEQQAFQGALAARMTAISKRKGPVQKGDDILLSVINDGRLAAIDMRLVDPSSDGAGSKLERMIGNIFKRWKDGADAGFHSVKPGGGYADKPTMRGPSTQIVFSTLGIDASKHNPDFSVHRFIKAELMRRGVPERDIVLAKDLKSHAQKQRAFNDMNEGKKRILVGSKSIFTGVNAQRRIASIHNLDPLWYPADDEQRNGRGLRQGNMNPEIEILDYSTKGTYDATMWQMMARKAAFIEAFYRGDPTQRDMEDMGEASQFEQAKAMTTRDPRILKLTDMKAARDKLRRRAGAVDTQRARLRSEIRTKLREMEFYDEKIERAEPIAASVPDLSGDKFAIKIGGKNFDSRSDAGKALINVAEEMAAANVYVEEQRVGEIGGFTIEAMHRITDGSTSFSVRFAADEDQDAGWSDDAVGLVRRIENALNAPANKLDYYRKNRAQSEKAAEAARKSLAEVKDFAQADELAQTDSDIAALEAELLADSASNDAPKESRFGDEPVATLTGNELGEWSDMLDLQRKARKWYRENLQGSTVVNLATGWPIKFTRAGSGKIGGKRPDYLLKAVPGLFDLLENAKLDGQPEADRYAREGMKAFHRFVAPVSIDGDTKLVHMVIREMQDGRMFYDLNLGSDVSARAEGPMDAREARMEPELQISADTLNIAFADAEINSDPKLTPALARQINEVAHAELAKVGIGRQVSAEAGGAGKATGSYHAGVIRILRNRGRGWKHTLDHEIIHALRDGDLWGGSHGLFTAEEWRTLVKAARSDAAIKARVEKAYSDKSTVQQTEEMVAELYADWAQGRRTEASGPLGRAFQRIRDFFRAVARALRGENMNEAAAIMERIASGEIGGRGPDGPGGVDRQAMREQREMGPFGAVIRGHEGNWKDAALALEAIKDGEAVDALTHPEVGGIALVWGKEGTSRSDGYGLSKLIAWHPEILDDLQGRISRMVVTSRSDNRIQLESKRDRAGVRLDWDGKTGKWLIGAYEKGAPRLTEKFTGTLSELWGGMSPQPRRGNGDYTTTSREVKEQRDMGGTTPEQDRSLVRSILDGVAGAAKDAGRIAKGLPGEIRKRGTKEGLSNALTDAMAMGDKGKTSILSLVPGRALFTELSSELPSARTYLRTKDNMDALRNEWHARADETAQGWRKLLSDADMNAELMDLMHEATLAQVDPSERRQSTIDENDRRLVDEFAAHPRVRQAARDRIAADERDAARWSDLRTRFNKLPKAYQDMFRRVRDDYSAMADATEEAVLDNVKKSMAAATRRAQQVFDRRMREIADEGLKGDEKARAEKDAKAALTRAKARGAFAARQKVSGLRSRFEANRLQGPYFPLARFGDFFATVRDASGEVVSFSRFERERDLKAFAAEMKATPGLTVEQGVLSNAKDVRGSVDPNFVAEVEAMLGDAGVGGDVMDQVWQHWLATLPDLSLRTNRIHRKGRTGFSADAFRAFGRQMFHGSHQLTRLKYGVDLTEALDKMDREAQLAKNPVRAGLVVNEMNRRHQFTMNPTNASWTQWFSSGAFVWHLAISPASAMVNISQTTVVGIPILSAAFQKQGATGASRELARALADFTRGRGLAGKSSKVSDDEIRALAAAYHRGMIDKSQAHDLAGVGETGVEYSDVRARWMAKASFFFHHAERLNREVTFLAAYRMARKDGRSHDTAVDQAGDLTWKTHFDYQNTSKPRFMQGDFPKVLLTFRNFTVNMLWRLFRDTHQAINAEKPADRAVARRQVLGMTASMMLHAGIKGTWGYGIAMMLAGLFFDGGDDEAEEELKRIFVGSPDDTGAAAALRRNIGGLMLNGLPGHVTGTSLSERIGMPNLWFRDSGKNLEGKDAYLEMLQGLVGPGVGLLAIPYDVASAASDGHYWRALEKAVPGAVGDGMKSGRYLYEGVTTWNGDDVVPDVSAYQALVQAIGFTPAEVAERYEANRRMMNEQERLMNERGSIQGAAAKSIISGEPLSPKIMDQIRDWNREVPEYPITADTIRQSVQGRRRSSQRNEYGIQLNPKLNNRIRGEQAAMVY